MISTELARALRTAGLRWHPVAGDRFMIDRGEFQGEVFTVSEMTIEVHEHPGGRSFGFNGTTEWALDSVDEVDTLWLPSEGQLRELLGASFRSLEFVDAAHAAGAGMDPTVASASISAATATNATTAADEVQADGDTGDDSGDADDSDDSALDLGDLSRFDVVTHANGLTERYSASTPEDAYAEALLSLVLRSTE
jgi:hypothetical protein